MHWRPRHQAPNPKCRAMWATNTTTTKHGLKHGWQAGGPHNATLAHPPPWGLSFATGSVNKNQFGCLNSQMVVRAVVLGTDCPGIALFALGQLASSIGSRVGYAFASDVWLVIYRALIPTGPPTTTAPRPTAPLATAAALASNCGRTQLNGNCYGRTLKVEVSSEHCTLLMSTAHC